MSNVTMNDFNSVSRSALKRVQKMEQDLKSFPAESVRCFAGLIDKVDYLDGCFPLVGRETCYKTLKSCNKDVQLALRRLRNIKVEQRRKKSSVVDVTCDDENEDLPTLNLETVRSTNSSNGQTKKSNPMQTKNSSDPEVDQHCAASSEATSSVTEIAFLIDQSGKVVLSPCRNGDVRRTAPQNASSSLPGASGGQNTPAQSFVTMNFKIGKSGIVLSPTDIKEAQTEPPHNAKASLHSAYAEPNIKDSYKRNLRSEDGPFSQLTMNGLASSGQTGNHQSRSGNALNSAAKINPKTGADPRSLTSESDPIVIIETPKKKKAISVDCSPQNLTQKKTIAPVTNNKTIPSSAEIVSSDSYSSHHQSKSVKAAKNGAKKKQNSLYQSDLHRRKLTLNEPVSSTEVAGHQLQSLNGLKKVAKKKRNSHQCDPTKGETMQGEPVSSVQTSCRQLQSANVQKSMAKNKQISSHQIDTAISQKKQSQKRHGVQSKEIFCKPYGYLMLRPANLNGLCNSENVSVGKESQKALPERVMTTESVPKKKKVKKQTKAVAQPSLSVSSQVGLEGNTQDPSHVDMPLSVDRGPLNQTDSVPTTLTADNTSQLPDVVNQCNKKEVKTAKKRTLPSSENKPREDEKRKRQRVSSQSRDSTIGEGIFIIHSQPREIEECFPLAITYNVEPKKVRLSRISAYINQHYRPVPPESLEKALSEGVEEGLWQKSKDWYTLTVEVLDPANDTNLKGQIANAILATTWPKRCQLKKLKPYVDEYHPEFDTRPSSFKQAMDKAIRSNLIRNQRIPAGCRRSPEVCTLVPNFVPSPSVLQGQDAMQDYYIADNCILYRPDQGSKPSGERTNHRRSDLSFILHSQPRGIDDTFPLAMTFCSDEHVATTDITSVTSYMNEHYRDIDISHIHETIRNGEIFRLWSCCDDYIYLQTKTVNPYLDRTITGKILNAIVATSEPKQATFSQLVQYVKDFHPKLLKNEEDVIKAINWAVSLQLIRPVAHTKTKEVDARYELVLRFSPSPQILKGHDKENHYTDEMKILYTPCQDML